MNDYYRILGVLDDAEDIVIKAAYRALAQRYHPDKWTGSKDEATKKMADINEAFSVLSDPAKRKAYDEGRGKSRFDESDSEEEDGLLSSIQRDWQIATEYYPALVQSARDLAEISKTLEFTYKAIILERKAFKESEQVAKALEKNYLEKYFGTNTKILAFAKSLIINKHKDAARELNKAVSVLGSDIDPHQIKSKIMQKFNLEDFERRATALVELESVATILARESNVHWEYGKKLLSLLGCGVAEAGLMNAKKFTILYGPMGKHQRILRMDDFKYFCKNIAEDFLKNKSPDVIKKYME